MKVLMVCLGNICRSPMAEGLLTDKVQDKGWTVDSAGTSSFHNGEGPDPRAVRTLKKHNIDISKQRSRKFEVSDFEDFDLILTMDHSNYEKVIAQAPNQEATTKVMPILDFLYPGEKWEVPDPYYGVENGFETVYDLLDKATEKIVEKYG
ncbi:MAG: low molecular weight protein-tyrosine-phosphatase [Schleiferiaceae bacterium]